jgi:protein SCO1/2
VTASSDAARGVAPRRSVARSGLVLAGLLVVAACASLWFALNTRSAPEDLPVIATVPDFSLTEASGRTVSRQDLAGRPWVADLVYTRCSGICPTMTAAMSRLVRSSADLPGVRFVSITVDPANDTPAALTAYAERFKADRSRWLFLTGDEHAIRRLAVEGLKLPLADGDPSQGDSAILHSQRFVLIDGESRVRATYDVRDQEAMFQLRTDLQRLTEADATG